MEYYKKGDGLNAKLIQKAFEAKGYTVNSGVGLDPNTIYFTVKGYKTVQRCSIASIIAILLEDLKGPYQELCLPKFKVGDVLQDTRFPSPPSVTVCAIDFEKESYVVLDDRGVQANIAFECIHKFYNYCEEEEEVTLPFEAGDLILGRDADDYDWKVDVFSHTVVYRDFKFMCAGGLYKQCIPFKGNKHLVGTSQKCCKQYPSCCYGKT